MLQSGIRNAFDISIILINHSIDAYKMKPISTATSVELMEFVYNIILHFCSHENMDIFFIETYLFLTETNKIFFCSFFFRMFVKLVLISLT